MRIIFLLLTIHTTMHAAIVYNLRDARFFGETTSRETTASGTFTTATDAQLPANTNGGSPTQFNALAAAAGSPFQLTVSNQVIASGPTALTFNDDFVTPTTIVSIVSSVIQENGVLITGGSGTGYLLPTFKILGTFSDSHPTATGFINACAGANTCALTTLANSNGGANVNLFFTPAISTGTDFTFGTPFTFFFFVQGSFSSSTSGTLAAGQLGVNASLEFVGYSIVDANGDPISGVQVDSEFLNPQDTPEPATLGLLACGAIALAARRRLTKD